MSRTLRNEKTVHGCPASGLAMAGAGVVGPCNHFSGDKRSAIAKEGGSDNQKKVGNVGQKAHKTGGMSRKSAGVVGAGKASGSNY